MVSQYDKDDVEAVGLVKFDFLGLRTLTILDWAERYNRAARSGEATTGYLARCRSTIRLVLDSQEGATRSPCSSLKAAACRAC